MQFGYKDPDQVNFETFFSKIELHQVLTDFFSSFVVIVLFSI
jgi:hypothetical protein